MKTIIAMSLLSLSVAASAKTVCVANCVTETIRNHEAFKITQVNALIQTAINAKAAEKSLDILCPNVLEGDMADGIQQSLGPVSCITL